MGSVVFCSRHLWNFGCPWDSSEAALFWRAKFAFTQTNDFSRHMTYVSEPDSYALIILNSQNYPGFDSPGMDDEARVVKWFKPGNPGVTPSYEKSGTEIRRLNLTKVRNPPLPWRNRSFRLLNQKKPNHPDIGYYQ